MTLRSKSIVGALGLALLVGAYTTAATRLYLAHRAAASNTLEGLERARRLAPWNADYAFVLARSRTLGTLDFPGGIAEYRRGLALNPYSSRAWLDLAAAYQMAGDTAGQTQAMQRAVQVDPTTPSIAWEVASFYVLQGKVDQALPHYRTVLSSQAPSARSVLEIVWPETRHNVRLILDQALPPSTDVHAEFLRFAAQEKDLPAARAIWARLLQLQPPVPTADALSYIQLLLDSGEPAEAVKTARELATLRPEMAAYVPTAENLIVNGDFEDRFLGGGLDWVFTKQYNTDLALDTLEFHSGNRSLGVTFDSAYGASVISQRIPVEAGEYRLSVFVKGSELNTAQGPRVRVSDAYSGAKLYLSEDVRGTTAWKEMATVLNVPPGTKALKLELVCDPPGSLIKGKFYADDFVLRRVR